MAGAGNALLPAPLPTGCTATGTNYFVSAIPLTVGSTGTRSFATNESGTIYQNSTGAAIPMANPIAIGGTITPIQ